jgi:hypothetical protein
MSEHQELIEILERQAVHIEAARRAMPIGVSRRLLKEEILEANVRALELVRRSYGRPCRSCGHYREEIQKLKTRLTRALWRIGNLRLLLQDARERWPDDPHHRFEGLSLLRKIEQVLDGEPEE